MSNLVFKYPLDLTGESATNLVSGEIHNLSTNPNRAFVSNYGPFYTESMIVVDMTTGIPLIKGNDYIAIQLEPDATQASGLEVCGIVVVTNPNIGNIVSFTAQIVGGMYSDFAYALQQMINQLQLNDQVIQWGQIIGKPAEFPPAPHLHSVDDVYGWEYLASAIDDLRNAILVGDQAAIDALRQSLISQFTLYQLKLGYVPVKQGATLGTDAGTIVFYSDGNGDIMGSLNGLSLGEVLFSSSQINTTLTTLEAEVAALSGAVTWGADNLSPADGSANVVAAPTLVGDMYYPQYGIPQQARQFQIITSNGTFDNPLYATALSPETTGAGEYILQWEMEDELPSTKSFAWRYRDQTIKNQYGVWSNQTYFNTSAFYVLTPTVTAPVGGATNVGPSPTITISPFAVSGETDTLSSVSIRILNSTGTVVWEQDNSTTQLNDIVVPAGYLAAGKTYTVQVRYFGASFGASAWSDPVSFTTAPAFVAIPTILSPTNNQLLTTLSPIVQISAFNAPVGSDTLLSTSIRVLNSAGIVAWEQDNSTTQLNNIQIPANVLQGGGFTYTIQVQYTGRNYGPSGWSPAVTVKTATFISTQATTSQQTVTTWTSSYDTTTSWSTSETILKATTVSRATATSFITTASKITSWTSTNTGATHATSVQTSRVSTYTTTWSTGVPLSRSTTRTSSYTTTFQTGVAKSRVTSRTSSYTTVWQTSSPESRSTTTSYYTVYLVCVAEGTPILLANGLEAPVESLYVGQELASVDLPGLVPEDVRHEDYMYYETNTLEGATSAKTSVASITKDQVNELYVFTVADKDRPLEVTPSHPLFILDVDGNYKFLSADQVTTDDQMVNEDLSVSVIEKVTVVNGSFTIYKVDCSPLDVFIHGGVVGHNMKVGGNSTTEELTSIATTTAWTTYFNTSQVTTAPVSYTTSWTSYYNTSNVTSAVVTYTTSWISYHNTSQLTSVTVSYTSSYNTVYSSTASLSRATTTSWTTSSQTLTTFQTSVSKTTSQITTAPKLTSTTQSRTTTTSWLTQVQTAE